MNTQADKYIISFPVIAAKKRAQGFYALAKKHIIKGKRGGASNLSQKIDEVVYGK